MLGIVATLKVKPGMEQEFETVARQLVAAGTYVFMERYVDDAAFEAHRKTGHMQTLGRKMGDYMDGRAQLMRLREIDA